MQIRQRVSIVMEWENVASSAEGRVVQVLAALAQQVRELAAASALGRLDPPLTMPVELLILFDPTVAESASVEAAVRAGLGACEALELRLIATPGLDYFQMKNHGARLSRGDLVVLLDSDVIPQPGWLAHLLGSFADPAVKAVASRAFVKPVSLYTKTVALTWLFAAPCQSRGIRPSTHFHANGAAFRRQIILDHPYPPTPGQSRGAGYDLLLNLTAAGITVFEQASARLDHPPPNGAWAYLKRGMTHGQDDYLSIRRRRGPRQVKLYRSFKRAGRKWLRALGRLGRNRRQVGLSLAALPAASAIVSAYFVSYWLGDLAARFRLPDVGEPGEHHVAGSVDEIPARDLPHDRRVSESHAKVAA